MKILHTSDWHLGHKLYGRQRTQEHSAFLDWLLNCIQEQGVELLIVAGDIFDSQTPSNQSLAMYYRFLSRTADSCCRHVIIIGGNHDSPTLLNAPRELLHFLHIHVIGRAPDCQDDELIVLADEHGNPELMVLAVPYLRDKDIRLSEAKEAPGAKHNKMLQGIRDHYARLSKLAIRRQKLLPKKIPIIGTGHLFCQGGLTRQGDGVRELYIGTLVQVGLDVFPSTIDYLALGHLHQPQRIAKNDTRRYCGAPLAMSFAEAGDKKIVLLVETDPKITIRELMVPCFQALQQISGDLPHILKSIEALRQEDTSILLEIHYQGKELIDDLQRHIHTAVQGSQLHVLRIKNKRIYDHILHQTAQIKTLEELTPEQVFQQCLDLHEIPGSQQRELLIDFGLILKTLLAADQEDI